MKTNTIIVHVWPEDYDPMVASGTSKDHGFDRDPRYSDLCWCIEDTLKMKRMGTTPMEVPTKEDGSPMLFGRWYSMEPVEPEIKDELTYEI
jgi:hypothetical protein